MRRPVDSGIVSAGGVMAGRLLRLEVAAALAVVGFGLGGAGAAETGFVDPAGDVIGGAGPDLTAIRVSHTASTVTFRIRFAEAPPLRMSVTGQWVDMLLIGIDVPPRSLKRAAHGWFGLDYYTGLHGADSTALVVKTSPARPERNRVLARPKAIVRGRTLRFSISRKTLGNPAWIEFVVASGREMSTQSSGGGGDEAPNRGVFHYELRG
jgi:hypothetical protein